MTRDYSDAHTYVPEKPQNWGRHHHNRTYVTGQSGRVGSFIGERLDIPHAYYPSGEPELTKETPDLTGVETVIHCAGMMTDHVPENLDNMAISLNIARAIQAAPSVKRLIYTSSLTADLSFTQIEKPNGDTPYAAIKRASEQLFSALADGRRSIVCLRLGHYSDIPIGNAPPEHEVLRLNDKALTYYIDQAMKAPAGFHVWNAAGQL